MIRLEWKDINFVHGHITIVADKSKTATRRLVPILSILLNSSRPYHRADWTLVPSRRTGEPAIAWAKKNGVDPWPTNASDIVTHQIAWLRLLTLLGRCAQARQ